ncbi:MAG: RDD family protein [Acidimicrobiales bacterium]|nr:RDD family protein [Acidimicrobiales bacterium]
MQLDDIYVTASPEGIAIEYKLAGLGSRFIALMVDSIVQITSLYLFALLVVFSVGSGLGSQTIGAILIIVGSFLIVFGYFILFEVLGSGKSLGKRATGIRVIRSDGASVTFRQSVIRNLIRVADAIPGLFYTVGAISIIATANNQRLGDLAAGTYVVRDRTHGFYFRKATHNWIMPMRPMGNQNRLAAPLFPPPNAYPLPPIQNLSADIYKWDVTKITKEQLGLIDQFLFRRWVIPPEHRNRLSNEIANEIMPQVGGITFVSNNEHLLECVSSAKHFRESMGA